MLPDNAFTWRSQRKASGTCGLHNGVRILLSAKPASLLLLPMNSIEKTPVESMD
jgi:hypothetical protein